MVSVSRLEAAPHLGQVQFTKASLVAKGEVAPAVKLTSSGRRTGSSSSGTSLRTVPIASLTSEEYSAVRDFSNTILYSFSVSKPSITIGFTFKFSFFITVCYFIA